ncbi:MspA family porin [Mycobacterium sp. 236(2023)]|uniref:MspA family porin n=1 Tax=Mycobacterium sp. 236(2023) TaxID=3038163 RepID=UPI0024153BB6|nr:MspA family porin [Mycobacterium sp. 236(2023)]MDG4665676.1 MspA family porin [Mycobacterium sp. 236(2023)]
MLTRLAALAALCLVVPVAAPQAWAQPAPPGPVVPPPPVPVGATLPPGELPPPPLDNGVVASSPPGVVVTPDGWTLSVMAGDETQLPVAPLTTAVSSREYLVGGTFGGDVTGGGSTELTGGTLEVGYQIGCGIELKQMRLIGSVGASTTGSTLVSPLIDGVSFPVTGVLEFHPRPGTVQSVTVNKKSFKKAPVRVTLKDVHIKIDGCLGQSFIRSYATMTSSSVDNDDIVAYYGVTKAV